MNGQVCAVGRVRSVKDYYKIPSVFYNIAIRWKNLSSLLNFISDSITYFWPSNVTCIKNNIGKVVYLLYGIFPSQHEHYTYIINYPLYLCTWTRYFNYEDKYFNKKITHLYTKPENNTFIYKIRSWSSKTFKNFIFMFVSFHFYNQYMNWYKSKRILHAQKQCNGLPMAAGLQCNLTIQIWTTRYSFKIYNTKECCFRIHK